MRIVNEGVRFVLFKEMVSQHSLGVGELDAGDKICVSATWR